MKRSEAEDFGRALGDFINALTNRDKSVYAKGFDAGLERAAEIAENDVLSTDNMHSAAYNTASGNIVAAIRAEKEPDQ